MYERFVSLLQQRGVSAYKVSKETGISQVLFSDWKSGKSSPKADKLLKIADYFGVSVEYFYGREDLPEEMSLDEQLKDISFALWGPIGDLSDDAKRDIIDYVNMKRAQEAQRKKV